VDIIPFNQSVSDAQQLDSVPPQISKLADVDPRAEIGGGVVIGPFCVVGPNVRIGAGTRLLNNVSVLGHVTMGRDNLIHPGAVVGGEPQDISYKGSPTQVILGDRNVIRENCTINRGTEKEEGITRIGSECLMMACSHVGHDCVVGDRVILGQGSMLGGHTHVDSYATLSGAVAATHFSSIGGYSFIGGGSIIMQDIPPFMLAEGSPARCKCTNIVALRRNRFSTEVIHALNEAFRLLYRGRVGVEAAMQVLAGKNQMLPEVEKLFDFLNRARQGRHGRARQLVKPAA